MRKGAAGWGKGKGRGEVSGQGHLVVPRSWGGVWVYSQCSGKFLERYRPVVGSEFIKRRERKEKE